MRRLALTLWTLLLVSCSPEAQPTKTQITLRLQIGDASLQAAMAHLRVSVLRKDESWVLASSVTIAATQVMRWPLDIPVVPTSPGAVEKQLEIIVDVLREDGQRAAQARVATAYAANSLRVLELWIYECAGVEACSSDDCQEGCMTCSADRRCVPVQFVPPEQLAPFTSADAPQVTETDGGPPPDGMTDRPPDDGAVGCTGEGDFRCLGKGTRQREQCVHGAWTAAEACAEGQVCDASGAAPGTCVAPLDRCRGSAGSAVCENAVLHVCGEDGTSMQQLTCASARHCELGVLAKACSLCVPGEIRCTGRLLERCDMEQRFVPVQECPETGDVCNAVAGACTSALCIAGKFSCTPDGVQLQRCNAGQTALEPASTCKPGLCDAIGGQCDECTPMAKDCDGNSSRVCNMDGQGYTVTPCAAPRAVCAGSGSCVECKKDSDCTAPECSVGACNIAAGSCAVTPAARGATCTGGLCDGMGKCGYCGDGMKQDGEDCDDGNSIASDACNSCKGASCGDGVVQAGEDCDDGNNVDTDTCARCRNARCGDGFVQPGEQCDDMNNVAADACNACKSASCGDSVVQAGEECDDGNGVDTDACANCHNARCGDGIRRLAIEECDDGNSINTDGCVACRTASCGDGFVRAGVEQCDDGNGVDTDGCTSMCRPASCGDGARQGLEQCDDGNKVNTDTCTNACRTPTCGDGFVQAGEQCDDGNTSNADACVACSPGFCGDGHVRSGVEECEINVGGWNFLDCGAQTCRRIYYNQCSLTAQCASGEFCSAGDFCSISCAGAGECPTVGGFNNICFGADIGAGFCGIRCSASGGCPQGLTCVNHTGVNGPPGTVRLCLRSSACCAGGDCFGCFWPEIGS